MTIEETYVKHIENGIRAIKLGSKKPEDVNLESYFKKLKTINDGLCDDLIERYDDIVRKYRINKENIWKSKF